MILKCLLNTQIIWMIFIEEHNPNKKHKILIFFDDMMADMVSNKNLNPIKIELFIRVIKLSISFVLFTKSYSAVPTK